MARLSVWRQLVVLSAVFLLALSRSLAAQDTTGASTIRLGGVFAVGAIPAVVIMPVSMPGGDSLRAIVQRDLDFSNRVNVLRLDDSAAAAPGTPINYQLYSKMNVTALVEMAPTMRGVRLTIHNVGQGRVAGSADEPLFGAVNSAEWRMAVHGISDNIEKAVTGKRGIAQTRILYVSDKTIRMVDSDGAGDHEVVSASTVRGISQATSPAWHPSGSKFAFVALQGDVWQIFEYDIETSKARQLTNASTGVYVTPAYSPDGTQIVYAYGSLTTNVYALSTSGGPPRRLTTVGSSNMYPSFSPDGRRIAYITNRTGAQEVYIMDADGTNDHALTSLSGAINGQRSSTDWSPGTANLIAVDAIINGEHQIVTINMSGSANTRTNQGENEEPSWAPDGRHMVITSTRAAMKQLWIYDFDTGITRQLTHTKARLAAWSAPLRRTS